MKSWPRIMRGTKEQQAMAQDAMNRWWWPSLDDVRSARQLIRPHSGNAKYAMANQTRIQRRAYDRSSSIKPSIRRSVIGLTVPDNEREEERIHG
jgi:1,2-phenylacetyl-CoA epoxidase catalytic subunit